MAKDYKDTTEAKRGMGKVDGAGVLYMSESVGTAKADGKSYTVLTAFGSRAPMVVSEQTGKTFTFDWQHLIDHAINVGLIDADGPANGEQ